VNYLFVLNGAVCSIYIWSIVIIAKQGTIDMTNQAENTKPNTTDTAEAALLQAPAGQLGVTIRFDKAADELKIQSAKHVKSASKLDTKLQNAVKLAVEIFAGDKTVKRADFLPQETKKDKKGNIKITQTCGKFGANVGSTNQANRISKAANNKTVQKEAKDAARKAGTKVTAKIVESVFTANGWTSYVKLTKATEVKRDKYPLNEAGKQAKAQIEKWTVDENPAGIEKMNAAGLNQFLHSIEAYRQ